MGPAVTDGENAFHADVLISEESPCARFLIDEKIPFSFRENGNVRGFSLGLKDAVSSEITNHHEQVQSHANDEYRNAEQDANSEAPYPEPLPEIERDTQQSDDGAANSGSRQPGLVGLF